MGLVSVTFSVVRNNEYGVGYVQSKRDLEELLGEGLREDWFSAKPVAKGVSYQRRLPPG